MTKILYFLKSIIYNANNNNITYIVISNEVVSRNGDFQIYLFMEVII